MQSSVWVYRLAPIPNNRFRIIFYSSIAIPLSPGRRPRQHISHLCDMGYTNKKTTSSIRIPSIPVSVTYRPLLF